MGLQKRADGIADCVIVVDDEDEAALHRITRSMATFCATGWPILISLR